MSSAVLRASGTKNKKMIKSVLKKKNSENIFGMKINEGKQDRKPVNVKSTFYDFNDYPNIMVNCQCDDRALSEYKKNKEDKQTKEEIEALDGFLKRKNKTKARRLFR